MNVIQEIFHRYTPKAIKRILDTETHRIDQFVVETVAGTNSGGLLLDAGAGECRFKRMLKNVRYVAIDAAVGDRFWDYSNIDIIGFVDRMPFKSNRFDSAICIEVLEHVRNPQQVINELIRTLKPGGKLCLTAPQGWGVHQPPHDYFRFTSYALTHLLEEAGFTDIFIRPSCGYFGYLANRLTVLPKILFWQIKSTILRLFLLPVEIASYMLFVLLLPILLNMIDPIDQERAYTLNYFARAKKPDAEV